MKKMIPVMMLSGIIGLSACGNKTEQPQQNADTLEVADTIKEDTAAIDTPQTAEVQENAQEEKTVEKNVKSTQAGGTTIAVGEPLAETLRKAKGVTFEYNADATSVRSISAFPTRISPRPDWIMSTPLPRTLNPISTSNSNTSSRLRRSRILRSTNLAIS